MNNISIFSIIVSDIFQIKKIKKLIKQDGFGVLKIADADGARIFGLKFVDAMSGGDTLKSYRKPRLAVKSLDGMKRNILTHVPYYSKIF